MDIAEIRKKVKSGKVAGKKAANKPAVTPEVAADPEVSAEPLSTSASDALPPVPSTTALATATPVVAPATDTSEVSLLDRLFAGCDEGQFASEEAYQTALVTHGAEAEGEASQFLAFQLGTEEYALDINQISEIIKPREYTDIPRVPNYILGLVSLRGVVVPIFDLKQRFQLGRVEASAGSRIIVCREGEITAGLLVDKINQVVKIAADRIEPPPGVIAGIDRSMITGIGRYQGRMIIMLNLASVLEIVAA